jgi:macrolide phosphotransferase
MTNRSPLVLAALANVALPGANAVAVRPFEVPGDYDGAEITYANGNKLIALAPTTPIAGASQAAELALLDELRLRVESGELPFSVPEVVASADLPEGGRVILTQPPIGHPIEVESLRPGPGLTSNVGRVIAAIHELPTALLERLEFPIYTAADYRARHRLELEAAGATGLVPPVLLQRWEASLDDATVWEFDPVVVHGDLAPEYLLIDKGKVTSISGWGNARVADPADDLAWLVAAASDEAGESILKAYDSTRTGPPDEGLFERAMLISELALARWLQYGIRENLPDVIADATTMLSDLAAAVTLP